MSEPNELSLIAQNQTTLRGARKGGSWSDAKPVSGNAMDHQLKNYFLRPFGNAQRQLCHDPLGTANLGFVYTKRPLAPEMIGFDGLQKSRPFRNAVSSINRDLLGTVCSFVDFGPQKMTEIPIAGRSCPPYRLV